MATCAICRRVHDGLCPDGRYSRDQLGAGSKLGATPDKSAHGATPDKSAHGATPDKSAHGANPTRLAHEPDANPTQSAHERSDVGRVLVGRYRLAKLIGRGGFGFVFEAEDTRLNKRVAVKLLSPGASRSEESVARFRGEALAASRVGHDSIIDVTDFGRDGESWFIVMELLEGESLAARLKREHQLDVTRAVQIAADVALGLAAAHREGIIHRDLKPANLFLETSGRVRILDFGISKILEPTPENEVQTCEGHMLGTPHYLAPECQSGVPVDCRADVFSLGVVSYELLTGAKPYSGRGFYDVAVAIATTPPAKPGSIRKLGPRAREIDRVVMRALAVNPAERWGSMEELHAALRSVLNAPERRPSRAWIWACLAITAAALALGVWRLYEPTAKKAPPIAPRTLARPADLAKSDSPQVNPPVPTSMSAPPPAPASMSALPSEEAKKKGERSKKNDSRPPSREPRIDDEIFTDL